MTRRRTARSRPATYRGAIRLARLVHELGRRPWGWSFDAIRDELGISERTLLRYLAACRRGLVDAEGRPLLEVRAHAGRRTLRLADHGRPTDTNTWEALSYYFALTVFDFLDGTVLKEGVAALWERFLRALPRATQVKLADFDRKFHSIPYAVKDYRAHDDTLDLIVRCLVGQHTMRLDYTPIWGESQAHDFDPYTLALYRGGLYLIGRSHRRRRIIYLAVERIGRAEQRPEHFVYPARYSPARHTEGMFGIVEGEEQRVALLLLNEDTARLLTSRRLHPTQRFEARPDGTTLLTMRVRGTRELVNWILSLGPFVRVLEPEGLRHEVRDSLAAAARLYA